MTTVYVVVENDWQYNDETFYQPEGSPGYPQAAFRTRAAADAEAVRRTVARVAGRADVLEYTSDHRDWWDETFIMPWYAWRDWVRDLGVDPPVLRTDPDANDADTPWDDVEAAREDWTAWWKTASKTMTPDQLAAVVSTMKLNFYSVEAVELVD